MPVLGIGPGRECHHPLRGDQQHDRHEGGPHGLHSDIWNRPQGPTGQVANTNASSFTLGDGSSAIFIFANLNGTISAWNPGNGTAATIEATNPGAIFTGLAINQAGTMLYAANGTTGAIDVYNSSFAPTTVPGGFVDPSVPSG